MKRPTFNALDTLTPTLIALGETWYPHTAHDVLSRCDKVGTVYSPERLLNAIAIMSPSTKWHKLLDAFPRWTLDFEASVPAYGKQTAKAILALLEGTIPTGPKVSAFARALNGDTEAVTIDLWMLRAWGLDDTVRNGISPTAYARLVTDFLVHIGRWIDQPERWDMALTPRGLQAALWLQERNRA